MVTVLESLNTALHQAFAEDERVILLGEDILDPYGGAFKVTRGLSTKFPDRVITTPISEAGIIGVGTGLALRGLRPIVEIMFGDFLTLAADQLINHAAKFRWMYNQQVRTPLVVRTPMGGRRGYGPTHSQTLEKLFMGIPGLVILSPHTLLSPGKLLHSAIFDNQDPVLFIENKLLYNLNLLEAAELAEFQIEEVPNLERSRYAPSLYLRIKDAPPPGVTIAAYGYMAEIARQAVQRLAFEYEVFVELVIPSQLTPFEITPVVESTSKTGKLITVEEASLRLGWGAEIVAHTAVKLGSKLKATIRVAALDLPVPASGPLESAVLPDVEKIIEAGLKIVGS